MKLNTALSSLKSLTDFLAWKYVRIERFCELDSRCIEHGLSLLYAHDMSGPTFLKYLADELRLAGGHNDYI